MNSFNFENQATIAERHPDLFRPDWWRRGKSQSASAQPSRFSCSGLSSSIFRFTGFPTECSGWADFFG